MKLINILFLSATLSVFLSCGNSENKKTDTSKNETVTTEQNNKKDEEVKKKFEGLTALAEKTNFTVHELNRASIFLNQKEGILVGYPNAYSQDTVVKFTGSNVIMIGGTDLNKSKTSVSISFKNKFDEKKLKTKKLFAVKGKFSLQYSVSDKWGNTLYLKMYDAEFLPAENTKYEKLNSLDDIDLSKPIFCKDLFNLLKTHYQKIYNKEKISVTGVYNGTTTSKDSKGNIIETRIDLYDTGYGLYDKVGCAMKEVPDEQILLNSQNNKQNITIEGKFAGFWNNAKINDAVIKQ